MLFLFLILISNFEKIYIFLCLESKLKQPCQWFYVSLGFFKSFLNTLTTSKLFLHLQFMKINFRGKLFLLWIAWLFTQSSSEFMWLLSFFWYLSCKFQLYIFIYSLSVMCLEAKTQHSLARHFLWFLCFFFSTQWSKFFSRSSFPLK